MSSRFKNLPSDAAPKSDEETVAALVAMLSGMGIDRSRIDAMISKTTRPDKAARTMPGASNLNEVRPDEMRKLA